MGQIATVGVRERMGDLYDEEVDHSNQLPGYRFLEKSEIGGLEPFVDVFVAFSELRQLSEEVVVFVDLVGGHDVRGLWY